jgi:hypothetical protein
MKIQRIIETVLMFFLLSGICMAQAPHQMGEFVLGKNIAEYKERVKMDTAMPIRHLECLVEVETHEMEGFRSGLINYGTCASPGRIVRIKLKYANSTRKFYDKLLVLFKKRFGEPVEWRGDPFHVVIAWRWSFVDKENNRISLFLQHNTKDEEEKMGNSVKLNMRNFIEDERRCFEEKNLDYSGKSKRGAQVKKRGGPIDWDLFNPRGVKTFGKRPLLSNLGVRLKF